MFSFKHLKQKVNFIIISSAFLVSITPSMASSGNGGGYNGPSLNSQSIPVQLDRGISLSLAGRAIAICLVHGDEKAGLISIADRFINAAFADIPANTKTSKSDDHTFIGPSNDFVYQKSSVSFHPKEAKWEKVAELNSNGGITIFSTYDYRRELRLGLSGELPLVKFRSTKQDSGYDDFGRHVKGDIILQDVYIELPKDYGSAVPIINAETGAKTKFTVNEVEYVECLQSQIQKYAE